MRTGRETQSVKQEVGSGNTHPGGLHLGPGRAVTRLLACGRVTVLVLPARKMGWEQQRRSAAPAASPGPQTLLLTSSDTSGKSLKVLSLSFLTCKMGMKIISCHETV